MRASIFFAALLVTQTALAADKTATDAAGRSVSVPEHPERVVVLHEPLIGVPLADLGLAPIGSYGRDDAGKTLMSVGFYEAVLGSRAPSPLPKGIGALGNLDLEKVRALDPDLIVGTEHDLDKAERLSTVAPVYLQPSSTGLVSGFAAEGMLADLVGRQEEFTARQETYHHRVDAVRASLPVDPNCQTYLAIFLTDQINAVGEMSGAIQAIEDLGFRRADLGEPGAPSAFGSTLLVPLSAEVFGRLDPDLLIVMNSYTGSDRDEAAIRARLDRIVPGWDRFLKPAREGRIVFLDSAEVTTPSIASALNTLEAFEEWAGARQP
ncbi:ABC transporter substrate-binding protein [Consotaella aegiceratis]|uniref:ABC transporter substrate-binding protein n=1 Tax=Consotaella aegiceratis TaxID=3097961 RepID=UPI002F3F20AE